MHNGTYFGDGIALSVGEQPMEKIPAYAVIDFLAEQLLMRQPMGEIPANAMDNFLTSCKIYLCGSRRWESPLSRWSIPVPAAAFLAASTTENPQGQKKGMRQPGFEPGSQPICESGVREPPLLGKAAY